MMPGRRRFGVARSYLLLKAHHKVRRDVPGVGLRNSRRGCFEGVLSVLRCVFLILVSLADLSTSEQELNKNNPVTL